MECPQCRIEREPRDFLGKVNCYKCVYKEKIKNMPHNKQDKQCALCGQPVPNNRVLYCSEECKDKQDRIRSYEKYHAKKEKLLMEGSDE